MTDKKLIDACMPAVYAAWTNHGSLPEAMTAFLMRLRELKAEQLKAERARQDADLLKSQPTGAQR